MLKKLLCIAILTAGMTAAAFAQEGGRVASPFRHELHPIGSVEIVSDGENPELVVKGELPDGCAIDPVIKTEHIGRTWFVDIYREIAFGTECTQVMTPYELHIDASALFAKAEGAEDVAVVVVNGKLFGVEYATDGVQAAMLTDLLVRGPLPYDTITIVHTQNQDMSITLTGSTSDPCPIPVYRAVPDWQNEGFVMVEAYTAINIAAMCAQVITPFEATFFSPVFDSIAINGVSVPFDVTKNVNIQVFNEQHMGVESATAEWVEGILPNIKITVTGTTDGCDFPIQVVLQQQVDQTYLIKVVRVMPEGTMCTMIARQFTEELYVSPTLPLDGPITFYINDQVVTLDPQ